MQRIARALTVALVLLVACGSSEADTTTSLLPDESGTEVTEAGDSTSTTGPGSGSVPLGSTTSTVGSSTTPTSSSSTSTTKPAPPTTKPTTTIPPGSTPVTDDSTPGGGVRPANAVEVTVSASQLFVIGGDTLYLVVEGTKVGKCQRLQYTTLVTGKKIEIDLFSVPDAGFCTPSTDYKDSLALGVYGAGSYDIFLKGNKVAGIDL